MSDVSKLLDFRENAKRAEGNTYTTGQHMTNFFSIFLKASFLLIILVLNF